MKILITTSGDNLDAPVDQRFGRAPKFLVYDQSKGDFTLIDNQQNLNAAQGAGVQAAQAAVDTGAEAVITGNCGPKAFQVLSAAGVKVYTSSAGTVKEALEEYQAGKLTPAQSANVGGHWS